MKEEYNYNVLDLLSTPYVKSYKPLIKKLGAWEAAWIGELLFRWRSIKRENKIDRHGWFFCKQKYFEEALGISKNKHTQIIKKFVEHKVLEIERRDIPAKNYYRINQDKLLELLDSDKIPDFRESRLPKSGKQDSLNDGITSKNNSSKNKGKESFLKKRACKQASLRNAISLNKKKPNTSVKHIRINSPVQKQTKRLRLDIESIEDTCPETKQLFDYWNDLDLIRHKDAPTKTKLNSYIQIQKFLRKHTMRQTKQAFDTYKKLCSEYPVKFSKQPYKVSLPDFFVWNPQQKQLVSLIDTLKNISGLVDVCVLGIDHAFDYFASKSKRVVYDNNIFSKMSNEASKLFGSVKVRRSSDALQRATARLEGFYKDRKRRFDSVSVKGLVPLLFTYVESSNDINSFKLWWLNSENTFNGFEEWLEENGYLKQLNCFDRPDTVYGKDGRIVRCAL